MSVKASSWAWDIGGLQIYEKFVLVRLADHSNAEGVCWPGKDSLAEMCCCSKRSVDRAIVKLEALGLIKVQQRFTDNGKPQSNVYFLQLDQQRLFDDKPPVGVSAVQGCPVDTHVHHDTGGVYTSQKRGVPGTPEPKEEPKEEPSLYSSSGDEVLENGYKTKKGKTLKGARLENFNSFWKAFDHRVGKAEAADAWIDVEAYLVQGSAQLDHILQAARAEAAGRGQLISSGATPKMAQGWLSGRRWEDHEPIKEAKSLKPARDPEWFDTLTGIHEKGAVYGMTYRDYSDPPDYIRELVDRMKAAGDPVPEQLLARERQAA